eukprot:5495290-Prymnesium_polylepis.1
MSQELRPGRSSSARAAALRARARSAQSQWAKEALQVNQPGRGGHMEAWVKPPTCSWDKCD